MGVFFVITMNCYDFYCELSAEESTGRIQAIRGYPIVTFGLLTILAIAIAQYTCFMIYDIILIKLQPKYIYKTTTNIPALRGGISIVIGLTLVKVKPGHEKSFYMDIQSRAGIKDVYRLFGEYSFFLIMQAEGKARLNQLLQDIEGEDRVIRTGPVMLAQ